MYIGKHRYGQRDVGVCVCYRVSVSYVARQEHYARDKYIKNIYENEHLYSARDSFDAFRLSLPQDYLIRIISLCEDVEAGIR